MEKINQKLGNKILNTLLFLALITAVVGFIIDFENTLIYGGVDLRNRVVAARLLIDGIDPYYFKWHQGMSDLLLDPETHPSWPISRATIPPTVLMLHAIIANLPYIDQRIIWFALQWGLLLLNLAILANLANSQVKSKLILILGLFFFSGSYFWRFHVERGQFYIVYVFLLTCAYWLAQKQFKHSYVLSGFLIGITVSLRLPVIVMLIPMLIYKQWKILSGAIVGILSGLLFSFTFAGISTWKSYFSAMKVWEQVHSGLMEFDSSAKWNDSHTGYPKQIEGMSNLSDALHLPVDDTSLQYLFTLLGIHLYPNMLTLMLCVALLGISFLLYRNRSLKNPTAFLFLAGMLMVLISEHFLPATRNTYNNIQWLLPVSLIIILSNPLSSLLSKSLVILLLSLFLSIGFTWMPYSVLVGDLAIILYTLVMLLVLTRRYNQLTT